MTGVLKIVYIGNRGHHSATVSVSTRNDERFVTVGVAGGDDEEDITAFYAYLKEYHSAVKKYEDYKVMLDAEKPDVAVISPRFDLTAAICIECANRGIHVIAEKPVALELAELEKLKVAVLANKIHFMAMHFLRFQDAFYQTIHAIRDGKIGDVRLVNAQKSYKLGTRDAFFKKQETYGGTIPWVGIHGLDWIYSVTGPTFEKVYATQSVVGNSGHGELESSCLCHYVLKNGVSASLSVDYFRPVSAPTHGDDRLRVVGTHGVIEVINGQATLINQEGVQILEPIGNKDVSKEFLESILDDSACELTTEEVFNITKIALLSRDAARCGQVLDISL